MGTRSKTTVFDENNKPILSLYRQFDGYFDGHGEELAEFLKNRVIVNGFTLDDASKPNVSNGMSCLAASLVAHFKKAIGDFYITDHDTNEEFNYEVRFVADPILPQSSFKARNRVSLTGKNNKETKDFMLYE
jgi:hypothetical protein